MRTLLSFAAIIAASALVAVSSAKADIAVSASAQNTYFDSLYAQGLRLGAEIDFGLRPGMKSYSGSNELQYATLATDAGYSGKHWVHATVRTYNDDRNIVIGGNHKAQFYDVTGPVDGITNNETKAAGISSQGVYTQAQITAAQTASKFARVGWSEITIGNVMAATTTTAFTLNLTNLVSNDTGIKFASGNNGKETTNYTGGVLGNKTIGAIAIDTRYVTYNGGSAGQTQDGVYFSSIKVDDGSGKNYALDLAPFKFSTGSGYPCENTVQYYDISSYGGLLNNVYISANGRLAGSAGIAGVLGYSRFQDFHFKVISTTQDTVLNEAKAKLKEFTDAQGTFETAKSDLASAALAYASATEGFDAAAAVVEAFNAAYAAGEFATYEEALAAWEVAQAAWSEASGILSAAQTAYETANDLFTAAQTAYNTANAAYGKWSTTAVKNADDEYNKYAIAKFNNEVAAAGSLASWETSGVNAPAAPGLVLAALGEVNADDFGSNSSETPEPATLLILGLGLAGLGLARRKK